MSLAETLCDFAEKQKYEQLDKRVMNRAKIVLLDAIGVALSGAVTGPGRAVIDFVCRLDGRSQSSIVGSDRMVSCPNAAFINGSLVEILELQDGHKDSGLHPSSVIPATAMAMSEYDTVNGRQFLTAIVIGYELMTRIGRAIRLSRVRTGTITTGTCGAFASAVTAGKLIGLNSDRMCDALGIAGYFAPLSLSGNYSGPTIKPFNVGQAGWVGVTSSLLSSEGFTASRNVLEEFYSVMSPRITQNFTTKDLGQSYEIMNLYFKQYACCRFTHAAAEAILYLAAHHSIRPESVDRIVVRTFQIATGLRQYTNADSRYIDCQFSIPYIVAVALLDNELKARQFSSERITDSEVHKLARKVDVVLDRQIDRQFPGKYAATVEVLMRDGKKHARHVDYPKGDPENPLTDDELIKKFNGLASEVIGQEGAEKVREMVLHLEDYDDVGAMVKLLH